MKYKSHGPRCDCAMCKATGCGAFSCTDACIDCDGLGNYPNADVCKSCGGSGRVPAGDGIAAIAPLART